MRFRLVFYDTKEEKKHLAKRRHEYLGDLEAIWYLWLNLKDKGHVEVYNLMGEKQKPEEGYYGMVDYGL